MKKVFKRIISSVLASAITVSSFAFSGISVSAALSFSQVGGYFESIYAEISGIKDENVTAVSWTGTASGSLTGDDLTYLVREVNGKVRIDIPGLKAGNYNLTVTTNSGTVTENNIKVMAYDRNGYAHWNRTDDTKNGIGAYNDDGTLKSNAKVLYVTEENKNTVSLTVGSKTVTGIGNILNSSGKESSNNPGKTGKGGKPNTNQGIIYDLAAAGTPLVVRFVGTVRAGDSNTSDNPPAQNINGLTAYDSLDYGGSVNDDGMMARIQSGKNITLEGIGADAVIEGWGFHFITESSHPGYGQSFEARNLTFKNYPEDALGMEGPDGKGANPDDSVGRCWIHNNSFYSGYCKNAAESDKKEGDGSCDFKRGQYYTLSYNYFENCHKTNLIGASDDNEQYNITFHNNYWKGCKARGPLGRKANIHLYNNYVYGQTDYAENARADALLFSEYCYFENCKGALDPAGGKIASYNDTFVSCLNSSEDECKITDKSQVASGSNNKYANFVTDSLLSYIPGGNYGLITDPALVKQTALAYAGAMKETIVSPEEVDASIIPADLYNKAVQNPVQTPYEMNFLDSSNELGKMNANSNTVKNGIIYNSSKSYSPGSAITITGAGIVFYVDRTVSFTMDGVDGTNVPVLYSNSGTPLIKTSGTVTLEPGAYVIQSSTYDVGTGKYKECKVNSIEFGSSSGEKVTATTKEQAEPTTLDSKTTTSSQSGGEETEETTEAPPYTGSGLVWNYTDGTNTLNAAVSGNDWTNAEPVSYNGTTLNKAIKMESSTSFSFRAPGKGKLVIVTYSTGTPKLKINGTSVAVNTNGAATFTVSAATNYTITKDTTNTYVYLIEFIPDGTATESTTQPTTAAKEDDSTSTTKQEEKDSTTTTKAEEKPSEATTAAPVSGVAVKVDSEDAAKGANVTVPVRISGISALGGYTVTVNYNSSKLEYIRATDVAFASGSRSAFSAKGGSGTIKISAVNGDDKTVASNAALCNIVFRANATDTVSVTVDQIFGKDGAAVSNVTTQSGVITVVDTSKQTLPGDADLDNDVDQADAYVVLKHISDIELIPDSSAEALANANADGIGDIDMADVIWILAHQKTAPEPTVKSFYDFDDGSMDGITPSYTQKDGGNNVAADPDNSTSVTIDGGQLKLNDASAEKTVYAELALSERNSGKVTYTVDLTPDPAADKWTMVMLMDSNGKEVVGVRTADSTTDGNKYYGLRANNGTTLNKTDVVSADGTKATAVIVVDFGAHTATLSINGGTASTPISFTGDNIVAMKFQTATGARNLTVDNAGIVENGSAEATTEATTKATATTTKATTTTTTTTTTKTTTTTTKTTTTTTTTTEATTETTTNDTSGLTALPEGTYDYSKVLSDTAHFKVSGNQTSGGELKINNNEDSYVELKVNDGATVEITYKCGSSNQGKTAWVILNGKEGEHVDYAGGQKTLTVSGLHAGVYKITAGQEGGTSASILSIKVTYGSTVVTEKTTETTTAKVEKPTQTTTAKTEKPTQATTELPPVGPEPQLSPVPSNVVKTVTSDSMADLKSGISALNNGGTLQINTPVIKVTGSSGLKYNGSNKAAIVGVKQPDGTYPVLDFSGLASGKRGLTIAGSNLIVQNVIVEGAPDNGIIIDGGKNNTIEHVIARYNGDTGIQLSNEATGNVLRYCYSYRNIDIPTYGANADGFAPKLGAKNTTFEYCYSWDNSDDGWDSYDKTGDNTPLVEYKHSACWNNGNTKVFTGEYDYNNNEPLDKKLTTVKQMMASDSNFESNYNNKKFSTSNAKINNQSVSTWLSKAEGEMNGNGFKFGSGETVSDGSVTRSAYYCVAFNHKAKNFDNNNSTNCTAYFSNCIAFGSKSKPNYSIPYNFKLWENIYGWNGGSSDKTNGKTVTKPSNTAELEAEINRIKDTIIDYCYANKFPDGITFDNVFSMVK